MIENDDKGYIALIVSFDDKDLVETVSVLIDTNTMRKDFDEDMYKVYSFGIYLLGLDAADLINIKENDDGSLFGVLGNSIYCGSDFAGDFYLSSCWNLSNSK